jgi:hypothetical protein
MFDIHALIKALPVYGLEPQTLAYIPGFPRSANGDEGYVSEFIYFFEPPATRHEPFVDPLDFLQRIFVYGGMKNDAAFKRAEQHYACLRQSLGVFERPVFYDSLEPDTSEHVSIRTLLEYIHANELAPDHLIAFFEKAAEVTQSVPLFDDQDGRHFCLRLLDLPDIPSPKAMIEFAPRAPWTDEYDEALFYSWRESMMPIAAALEERLGESVYHFQDLDDDIDDDSPHRFLSLHWCCTHKPESKYVRYLKEASGAGDIEELKSAMIDPLNFVHPFEMHYAFFGAEALACRLMEYLPPGKRKIVGVLFSTEKARPVAESILLQQIDADIIIVAPEEILHDQTAKTGWDYSSSLMEAMRFRNTDYLRAYRLRNGMIEKPIDFLARIDKLYVVADDKTRKGIPWDLNLSNSIEELMWKAIATQIPTYFFHIDGFGGEVGETIEKFLEKNDVPERVAAQDIVRKEYTSKLPVICVDCDWSSSGLWTEDGKMIPYDYIDLPLPLMRRIIDWHEEFDATLDEVISGTGPSDEWDEKHEREKREIALELQKTLGNDIIVQVCTEEGWTPITQLKREATEP